MLLRSLAKHVKDQNWFAVALDFLIVVVGILIALQITNWNESRAEFKAETNALARLQKELNDTITTTDARARAYEQAAAAAERSLNFLDGPKECEQTCWNTIVDFMHASQWQNLSINESSYQNMRTKGFPVNTNIIDAVENYRLQALNNSSTFVVLPVYRSLVRQLIDLNAQKFYWNECWSLVDGIEEYVLDCPEGVSSDAAELIVEQVVKDPDIKQHLTEWAGTIVSLPATLGDQNKAAQVAIDLISEELIRR